MLAVAAQVSQAIADRSGLPGGQVTRFVQTRPVTLMMKVGMAGGTRRAAPLDPCARNVLRSRRKLFFPNDRASRSCIPVTLSSVSFVATPPVRAEPEGVACCAGCREEVTARMNEGSARGAEQGGNVMRRTTRTERVIDEERYECVSSGF